MLNLTKSEIVNKHREMWNWIAEETWKQKRVVRKEDYFDSKCIPENERPFNLCYCCEYVWQGDNPKRTCYDCPVKFVPKCINWDSLYKMWMFCEDYILAMELAKKIANLEER